MAERPPNRAPKQTWANPALAEGMRQIRRSNAAGTHEDKRTRRARTRKDARGKAIHESMDN